MYASIPLMQQEKDSRITQKKFKNLKTEEVKRRRGRVYGRQEEKEEKMDEEEAADKGKGVRPLLQIEISRNAFSL